MLLVFVSSQTKKNKKNTQGTLHFIWLASSYVTKRCGRREHAQDFRRAGAQTPTPLVKLNDVKFKEGFSNRKILR